MDQTTGTGEPHVSLPTAAAVVYQQVMGTAVPSASPTESAVILDRVAGAIANVAPIYTADRPSGEPRQLAPIELIHCRFEGGALRMRTSFGLEYGALSIRRDDMRAAIAILKGAGVRFSPPGSDPPT